MWIKVTKCDDQAQILVDEYKIIAPIVDVGTYRNIVFDAVKTHCGEKVVIDGVSVIETLDEIQNMLNGISVKQTEPEAWHL